jgi:hypothetical protein
LELARRVRQNCGMIFRHAVATGRAERDPTGDLRGALAPPRKRNFAAITDPRQVGGLLRAIDGYQGSFIVRAALRLAPLVFVRPGNCGPPNGRKSTLSGPNGGFRPPK